MNLLIKFKAFASSVYNEYYHINFPPSRISFNDFFQIIEMGGKKPLLVYCKNYAGKHFPKNA